MDARPSPEVVVYMLSAKELARLRSGDDTYFAELDRRFTPSFRRYVRMRIRRRDDVDDVLQETRLHVFERRAAFTNRGSLDSWLWSICRNCCTDWLRAQHRNAVLSERITTFANVRPLRRPVHEAIHREEAYQSLLDAVDRVLYSLPPNQFDVVIYRWILLHPTKLTASLMHCAPGTVKATLHQAGRKLRIGVSTELVDDWIDTDT